MDWLSYVYLAVFALALGVVVFVRTQLVFTARPRRFWLWFYGVAAVMIGGFTLVSSHTASDYISGLFISGMLLLFCGWRQGVTADSLITGVGRVIGLQTLTLVKLAPTPAGCTLTAMAGEVTVAKLTLKQPAAKVATFLQHQLAPERVVIER